MVTQAFQNAVGGEEQSKQAKKKKKRKNAGPKQLFFVLSPAPANRIVCAGGEKTEKGLPSLAFPS